jgi:hypothetical protein
MESENTERVSDVAEDVTEDVAENMTEGKKGRGRFMDTAPADIPEAIVRKLARIAGLEYVERHKREGGGLCLGIIGKRPRRRALMILGQMAGNIGKGSTEDALKASKSSWLEVVEWREDAEYAALWAAAVKVRREVAASRLEDDLWGRSLNGYDIEDVRGGERVTLRKFDNNLGVNLLKGLGFVGKDVGVKVPKVAKGAPAPKPVPGVDGAPVIEEMPGASVDTVLFADRATAFKAMGQAVDKAEEVKGG